MENRDGHRHAHEQDNARSERGGPFRRDKRRSQSMVDFIRWALTDGQKSAPGLGYGSLPPEIVKLELAALATIKVS